ncbi:MAG: NAD(P)H-hydrate dehydratase [Neisseriaceae bacterium]|nr:MAG: NAD(P)H-hydrate dehydratase [Neisseriaceae bacterium]
MRQYTFFQKIDHNWLQSEFPNVFKERAEDSHKGTFGSLVILGGSKGMQGALVLAGQSALKMGCGKVYLGFVSEKKQSIDYIANSPEIMIRNYQDYFNKQIQLQAAVVGCGLGHSLLAQQILQQSLLRWNIPIVLDADALNLLAKREITCQLSATQHILTPHPLEAARLLHTTVEKIQSDRIQSAYQIAQQYCANVILKGHQTIVYSLKDDSVYINQTGNSGLATAGTGDVLSGILGSLLAQGFPISESIKAGVFLHGLAADWLVSKRIGPIGLTASEIIDAVRDVRNQLTYHHY